jgi:hypothetical protein
MLIKLSSILHELTTIGCVRISSTYLGLVCGLLLAGCNSHPAATVVKEEPVVLAPIAPPLVAPVPVALPDTVDVSSLDYRSTYGKAVTDTLVKIGGHHYRLQLKAWPDSSQQLKMVAASAAITDSTTAVDEQAGDAGPFYNVRYTITLLDSVGHQRFRRTFTKPSFYPVMGKELVLQSIAISPEFIGYNAPRQLLLFRQEFGVDGTDWMADAYLALDLNGKLQQLKADNDYGGGGADCRIQQSPDGRAILTCKELILPSGRHQSLHKPDGLLVAARFLSDTTLLTVYDFVTVHQTQAEYYKSPIPRYRTAPNAFILSARTGKAIARFRYNGYYEELGYTLPRHYAWQTKRYYLLDDSRHVIRIIPKEKPQLTHEVSLLQVPKFKAPRQQNELRVPLATEGTSAMLYVDTVTQKMRFQVLSQSSY